MLRYTIPMDLKFSSFVRQWSSSFIPLAQYFFLCCNNSDSNVDDVLPTVSWTILFRMLEEIPSPACRYLGKWLDQIIASLKNDTYPVSKRDNLYSKLEKYSSYHIQRAFEAIRTRYSLLHSFIIFACNHFFTLYCSKAKTIDFWLNW